MATTTGAKRRILRLKDTIGLSTRLLLGSPVTYKRSDLNGLMALFNMKQEWVKSCFLDKKCHLHNF